MRQRKRQELETIVSAVMRALGHASPDPQVVSHCFAGETRYLTPEGWQTFEETVGTEQMVLTRVGGFSTWVPAHIHPFGEQPIWELHLRRNQRTMVIRTTEGHRWITRSKGGRTEKYRDQPLILTTAELTPGHRLDWCLPVCRVGQTTPSPAGIAHGFTYGDGTRAQRGSKVTLWGDKDAHLLPYFGLHRTRPAKTPNGVLGAEVLDLPGFFKDRPSLGEAAHYVYGFLAGWFAADGTVDAAGSASLCSATREDLVFAQQAALSLGIASYDIVSKTREGFGADREIHSLTFVGSSLRESFFLIPEHRERYLRKTGRANPERLGWTVERVVPTSVVEPVYCAVVPEYESFTIEGFVHTKNCPFCGSGDIVARSDGNVECSMCTRQFTIAEQPAYSAIPGSNAGNGPQQAPPDAAAPESQHQLDLPAVDPQAAAAAPPFVVPEDKGADEQPPNTDGSPAEEKPADDGSPFAKKSAAEESTCKKCGDPIYKSQYGWEHKAKPGIDPGAHRHRVVPIAQEPPRPSKGKTYDGEGDDGLTDLGRELRRKFKTGSEAPDCAKCGYWKATDGDLCEMCAKEEEDRDRKYRTQKGAVLSEPDYVMHLALQIHPEVRTAVLGHRREVNA